MKSSSLGRIESALQRISRTTSTRRAHGRWAKEADVAIDHVAFRILSVVCVASDVRSVRLAQLLDVEAPLVSREVGRLEERGLVVRVPDSHDKRSRIIEPTRAGRELYQKYRTTLDRRIAASVTGWSDADLATLASLLERFAHDVSRPSLTAELRGEPSASGQDGGGAHG